MKVLLIALTLAAPVFAQFELLVVDPAGVRAAPPVFDLGAGYAGETLTARFRLRNITTADATVSNLAVAGLGFTLAGPAIPVKVEPQVALEFTVAFRAADPGGYSAVLRAANNTILLTASTQWRLTFRVDDQPLPASVDFGRVQRGARARRRFTVLNETPLQWIVPPISIAGSGFFFVDRPPTGTPLGPNQSAEFAIDFAPAETGANQATLVLGDRTAVLAGTCLDPPLPRPALSLDLKQPASAQQGALVIAFDKPAETTGSGFATLDFRGSADPTIAFAAGGRTASFQVHPGDSQAVLPFQTGTTTGDLVFTVRLGDTTQTITLQIPAAPPVLSQLEASRTTGSIAAEITGWDNAHSISQLAFTFYDATDNPLPPGVIRVDATAEFARFYGVSDSGGTFVLRAVFPVTGDAASVASFDVSLSGAAGTVKSTRTHIR